MAEFKEIMLYKENPLTGDWLCWIPKTSQGYYYKTKKAAKNFCNNVYIAFAKGELIIKEGQVIKID